MDLAAMPTVFFNIMKRLVCKKTYFRYCWDVKRLNFSSLTPWYTAHIVHFKLIINYPLYIVLIGRWSAPLFWYRRSRACTCSTNHGSIQATSGWTEVGWRIHFTNINVVKTVFEPAYGLDSDGSPCCKSMLFLALLGGFFFRVLFLHSTKKVDLQIPARSGYRGPPQWKPAVAGMWLSSLCVTEFYVCFLSYLFCFVGLPNSS